MEKPGIGRRTAFACISVLCLLLLAQTAPESGSKSGEIPSESIAARIVRAARAEVAKRTLYREEYLALKYPGGDVPQGTGVCTDLVIRALRAIGVDLQKELHEDRAGHPEAYPTDIWAEKRPDRNIDHRRCQNLCVWFRRFTQSLPIQTDEQSLKKYWLPGDIVFFVRPGQIHPWHVAVVSDKKAADGMPLIIEGYPVWFSEFRRLDDWAPIHSHFRVERIP